MLRDRACLTVLLALLTASTLAVSACDQAPSNADQAGDGSAPPPRSGEAPAAMPDTADPGTEAPGTGSE